MVVSAVGVNELSHAQEKAEDDRGGREMGTQSERECPGSQGRKKFQEKDQQPQLLQGDQVG